MSPRSSSSDPVKSLLQIPARCPHAVPGEPGLCLSWLLETPVLHPWRILLQSRKRWARLLSGHCCVFKKNQGLTRFSVRAGGLGQWWDGQPNRLRDTELLLVLGSLRELPLFSGPCGSIFPSISAGSSSRCSGRLPQPGVLPPHLCSTDVRMTCLCSS